MVEGLTKPRAKKSTNSSPVQTKLKKLHMHGKTCEISHITSFLSVMTYYMFLLHLQQPSSKKLLVLECLCLSTQILYMRTELEYNLICNKNKFSALFLFSRIITNHFSLYLLYSVLTEKTVVECLKKRRLRLAGLSTDSDEMKDSCL